MDGSGDYYGEVDFNGGHLAVAGAVRGEEGETASTVVKVISNWGGSLTLVPAEGRENEFGRLVTEGRTVVGAGMTRLSCLTAGGTDDNAIVYAKGDGAAWGWKGTLDITNGTLKVVDTAHKVYVETAKWGRIRVTGGKLDCLESHELLNGLSGPGRVEVSGTGVVDAYIVRVSQSQVMEGDLPAACIYLGRGGMLRLHHFSIDSNAKPKGRVDFDGGTLKARSSRDNMFGSGTGAWTEILFRVCAGGAVVDTAGMSIQVRAPFLTGVADGVDGGLTKKGSGSLFMRNGDFTYTGPTRTDKGQLIFEGTDGTAFDLPGDLEVSVSELAKLTASERNGTYIQAKSLKAGARVRVVDVPDVRPGEDPRDMFGKKIAILKVATPITRLPEVVTIDKDGNEKGPGKWGVTLSADGKTLFFGPSRGAMIIVR